jgi:hypothetical protein
MVRLLVLTVLLVGGGIAFRNEWVVVNWQKVGHDLHVPSLFDHSLFGAEKTSDTQDGKPSR